MKQFSVRFNDEEYKKLEELCLLGQVNKSEFIRGVVLSEYDKAFADEKNIELIKAFNEFADKLKEISEKGN